MDIQRVKEIMNSSANIEVLYNYHPVWIDGVDDKAAIVKVRILDMREEVYVPVEDLVDTGKVINIDYKH
ncbi:H-type small acid-soluble spore protein [Clostridium thailandense]|uniref:H-type small acid-soluble spore protein n=1 Tax=Clostridium thailandense TaxID=2794346 RepID=A0A949U2S4_9CLOT|nr:H-type small acid-soluble spore protein [Clostridium thailandense]MBV7275294.1 H-type small acid-soluble spore protein [Clostridium thailandense]MCH5135810.1 H-type small acid-soluble spore protein [Clostridiaceae bacterium UIB06]